MAHGRISSRRAADPLLAWLFAAWPDAKRNTVRDWLKNRHVAVNGRVVSQFDHHAAARRPGDDPHRSRWPRRTRGWPGGILIRHEDDAVLVIEKPAGLRSIASEAEAEATAYAHLTHACAPGQSAQPRAGVDRAPARPGNLGPDGLRPQRGGEDARCRTTGTRWRRNTAPWSRARRRRNPACSIRHLDESDRFRSAWRRKARRRAAPSPATAWRSEGKKLALVELTLETGRRHQIRVQLGAAGCPIVGDKRYGAQTDPIKRVALHASELRFTHPVTKKPMRFVSPLPGDFGKVDDKR